MLGDGERGGVGEAVAVADHELVERVRGLKASSAAVAGVRRRRVAAGATRPSGADELDARRRARAPRAAQACSTRPKRSLTQARLASGAATTSVAAVELVGRRAARARCGRSSRRHARRSSARMRARIGRARRRTRARGSAPPREGQANGGAEGPARARSGEYSRAPAGPVAGRSGPSRKSRDEQPAACAQAVHARASAPPRSACGIACAGRALRVYSGRAHEAHLPAQEAQARPHPRLPRPHAAPAPAASCSSAAATRAASG